MNYQKYSEYLKGFALSLALLGLAACSDSGGDTETADPAVVAEGEAAAAAEAQELAAAAGGEGVWGDIVYGDPDAPVEIIEYASLTCPHCARFAADIFPKIQSEYIDTGKVKFIYRNYVMNPYDMAASVAARCKTPDVAKRLMKVYFDRQAAWVGAEDRVDALAGLARRAGGISRTQFDRCIANRDMQQHLAKMTQDGAARYNVNATPTLLVDGSKVEATNDWNAVKAAIEAELN